MGSRLYKVIGLVLLTLSSYLLFQKKFGILWPEMQEGENRIFGTCEG